MKKIKFFAVATLMAICSSASAQFTSSLSSRSSSTSVDTDGWSSIWVEYNPVSIKYDSKGVDDESATGLSLGYSQTFPITKGTPLFLELGLGLQYTFNTNDDDIYIFEYDDDGNIMDYEKVDDGELKTTLFSAKVPVNLLYAFQIPNSSVRIMPFVGANLRYNLSGKRKYSFEGDEDWDDDDLEMDVFDKKDMGSSKATWKRFQLGWNIGVKARLGENFLVGLSYGNDFSELAKKTKMQTTSISIGYTF